MPKKAEKKETTQVKSDELVVKEVFDIEVSTLSFVEALLDKSPPCVSELSKCKQTELAGVIIEVIRNDVLDVL